MTEQIASVWEAITSFLTSKITNSFVAGSLIISAEAAKQSSFINITESGFLWFTWAVWFQVVACVYLLVLISEKIGIFNLLKWILSKKKDTKKDKENA